MKIFEVTENISHTSKRLRDIEQERDVKIGSDEWFKLWFSLPYLKKNLKESSGHSYLLQLERDNRAGMLVLHILDQKTGKRTEVRGKLGYETNGYDPEDKLHQILDKVGKSASVSDLMNGDVVSINPRHPQGPAALKVAHDLTNESNPFTNARMNAIKAGKTEFTVGGKTYKVTGDTSDEEEAVANENFADGKNPERKGLAKRVGVDTKASVSDLRKTAKNSSGEKQRMAHWLANMKAGKAKNK